MFKIVRATKPSKLCLSLSPAVAKTAADISCLAHANHVQVAANALSLSRMRLGKGKHQHKNLTHLLVGS